MPENFRKFEAGPDPFGRTWQVEFEWLQNATAIRHADAVDVKFRVGDGSAWNEKVIALPHDGLLQLSKSTGHPLTDPWCLKLAALYLRHMIETSTDMEKAIAVPTIEQLRGCLAC